MIGIAKGSLLSDGMQGRGLKWPLGLTTRRARRPLRGLCQHSGGGQNQTVSDRRANKTRGADSVNADGVRDPVQGSGERDRG